MHTLYYFLNVQFKRTPSTGVSPDFSLLSLKLLFTLLVARSLGQVDLLTNLP